MMSLPARGPTVLNVRWRPLFTMLFFGAAGVAESQTSSAVRAPSQWEPSLFAGAWSLGSASRRSGEPALGAMAGIDVRRTTPSRRSSFVASIKGYTKNRGRYLTDSATQPREYSTREHLVTGGIGVDWDLTRTPHRWFVGLGGSAATGRQAVREVTSTGIPFNPFGDDDGWERITGVVSVRTGHTMSAGRQWGIRLLAEAFQGVGTITERAPMFSLSIGVVRGR